jgi:hypothetical protein
MSRRFSRSKIAVLEVLVLLLVTMQGCGGGRSEPLVAIEVEAKENTLDGCTACGCRAKGELEPGAEHDWWISFGLVTSDAQGSWEATASSSHCASGSFEKTASDFMRTVGTPYVLLDLSTTAVLLPAGRSKRAARLCAQ